MGSRFVRPDSRTLTLANGDTLIVKRRLSAVESRIMRAMQAHPTLAEPGVVMAYLLDWSLKDDDGQRVVIAGVASNVLASALDSLDADDFDELYAAIAKHAAEMKAERDAAKKKATTTSDDPTSRSPSVSAGELVGSAS